MAAPASYRLPKRPLDQWSMKEKLALASSVCRSGDQNWVSVSRAIKPFAEGNRPPDWFSQKNCALQYADLLEQAETPKRKRGEKGEREVVETPAVQIVRRLTIERLEELKQILQQEQAKYKQLKKEVEAVNSGKYDDQLDEMWTNIQAEKKAAEERQREEERKLAEEMAERARAQAQRRLSGIHRTTSAMSSMSEMDESTQDSVLETVNVETTDDEQPVTPVSVEQLPSSTELTLTDRGDVGQTVTMATPGSLVHMMLQSQETSVNSLQQLKNDVEAGQAQMHFSTNQNEDILSNHHEEHLTVETEIIVEDTDVKVENETEEEVNIEHDIPGDQFIEFDSSHIKEEIVECDHMVVEETIEVMTHESPLKTPTVPKGEPDTPSKVTPIKLDLSAVEETVETTEVPLPTSFVNVDEEVSLKEEPLSPASSISSRMSESGSKSSSRKGKGGRQSSGVRRGSFRSTRKSTGTADDLSSRPSDIETSDDDGDSSVVNMAQTSSAAVFESIPNSPHSSHCSDTEDDKSYKAWKKTIMVVWRGIANHKYASVFLHPVKDDFAPGYSAVVKRPKDLTNIKRHIENGTIRTTAEFQRDMMLMFTNAIMYNNANHDVYRMATEMYNDVMEQIEQYASTQLMLQNTEAKLLRPTRRNESSDKEEETRRRRTSSEAEGGKAKKRKSRADDN